MVDQAIPRTADELEEFLNDKGRTAQAFETPAQAAKFIVAYRDKANEHDPDLNRQAQAQRDHVLAEFLDEKGLARQARQEVTRKIPFGESKMPSHRRSPGVTLNGSWDSFGEFLDSCWHRTVEEKGMSDTVARSKALGEGQGDQGGFLVPEEYRVEILMRTLEMAVVRPRATVIPMARETLRVPAIRDTTHASTVFGGVQAYWIPEAGTITQSDPTFAQVRLEAKKLVGSTRVGNELMADSAFALESLLNQLFGAALAYFEDDAFIAGIGGGQPVGIKNADAMVSVAKETGQAATTIVWENIIKMFARCLPQSLANAVWVAHMDTIPQLATMSLSVGTGGSAMWVQSGAGALPTTLLGRPIVYTEKAETVGTAGDIYLADFGQYLIGDRMSLEMASSVHSRFLNDQTEWRFISRLDGKPWMDSAVTPRNGSNTLSPYLNIAVRS